MPPAPQNDNHSRRAKLSFQSLEDRRVLAAFGTPWPDARDLSISFPADGVSIGENANSLHELLDQVADRQDWQELVLRSYQTWAIHSDINIGLQADLNSDFGVPGLQVNDPRFGEFRIGAFPQVGVIANSVPFQAIAGTYSGDLVLNSNENFAFHKWEDGVGPAGPTSLEQRDLFTLLLHEAGNTLGLEDNGVEWSVMFAQYNGPNGALSEEDIKAITALYGERSDPYESISNDQIQSSTPLVPVLSDDSQVATSQARGSLRAGSDVDHYRIQIPEGSGAISVQLKTQGISLLEARLEVIDSFGQVLDSVESESVFQNDCRVTIPGLSGHDAVFLRISAKDPSSVYSVGDYAVEVSHLSHAEGRHQLKLDRFGNEADASTVADHLFDLETDENNSIATASDMSLAAHSTGTRFEHRSSVTSSSDVDFLKFTSPEQISGRLIVHLAGANVDNPDLRLRVVDSQGNPVGTSGRVRPDGTLSVEVAAPKASEDYYLRVSVDSMSAVGVGNYVAIAEFEGLAPQMNHVNTGTVSESSDRFFRWTAHKSKLFRFDVAASETDQVQGVRMTIYDAHTREVKASVVTHSGVTRGLYAWLDQGEYVIRVSTVTYGNQLATPMSFSVWSDGISDDQDDNGDDDPYYAYTDPSYDPDYYGYDYYDPSGSDYYGPYY